MAVSSVTSSLSWRPRTAEFLPSGRRRSLAIPPRGGWIRQGSVGVPDRSSRVARALEGQTELPPVEITWQIAVGALAGVTPFVVAGIEFGKRIAAQKKCEVCGGSGLVKIGDIYGRCPGCGGFLPWQSWKRFFTG